MTLFSLGGAHWASNVYNDGNTVPFFRNHEKKNKEKSMNIGSIRMVRYQLPNYSDFWFDFPKSEVNSRKLIDSFRKHQTIIN